MKRRRALIFITEAHLSVRVSSLQNWLKERKIDYQEFDLNIGHNLTFWSRLQGGKRSLSLLRDCLKDINISKNDVLVFTSHEGFEFANLECWLPSAVGHPCKLVIQHGTFSPSERVNFYSRIARKTVNIFSRFIVGYNIIGYGYNGIDTTYYLALQDFVARDLKRKPGVSNVWLAPHLILPSRVGWIDCETGNKLCLFVLQDFVLAGMSSLDHYKNTVMNVVKQVESQGYSIVIKPHPKSPKYEFLKDVDIRDGNLDQILYELRPEFVLSFYSSAVLEAEILGFKCICVYFPNIKRDFFWYRNTVQIDELNLQRIKSLSESNQKDGLMVENLDWQVIYEYIVNK
jgi:hypothetical protein